jgi:hypothetical protein
LTVLPKGTMTEATKRAETWLKKFQPQEVLTVDVAAARLLKVYPLPPTDADDIPTITATVVDRPSETTR